MSSIVSIDTRGYDISMGPGVLRVGGGGGLAGNVYINGNVGIGVINPTARLEVSSTGLGNNTQLNITSTTASGASTTNTSTLNLKIKGAGGQLLDNTIVGKYFAQGFGTYGVSIGTAYGSNQNVLNVLGGSGSGGTGGGRVGINTTDPAATLDVRGDAQIGVSTNKCIEIISGTTDLTYINFHSKDVSYNNYDTRITSTGGSTSGQTQRGNLLYSALNHAFNTGGVDRMTITSTGSVGIGTTTPAYTLDVSGTITSTGLITANGGINTSAITSTGTTDLAKVSARHYVEVGANIGLNLSLIDFHANSNHATDYEARIQVAGGTTSGVGTGSMSIYSGGVTSNGLITADGGIKIKNTSTIAGIQYGIVAGGTGTGTITFPVAFSSIPVITATIATSSSTQVFSINISAVSATQFTYTKTFIYTTGAGGGAGVAEPFWWIAICS